ncbi:VOC family protein [Rugamonas sp.]|uniref:VOC family protein n=1 Tax=Rugamonas sp. TaxID=1926287 RepID=UPI0025EE4095|nr:VOC family protein [Rugamonas sp.]
MLTGINHLTLAVSNLPSSLDFYTRLLNFRLHAVWDTGAYLSLGELWLCLSLEPPPANEHSPSYTHYGFTIEQSAFIAFQTLLKSEGVKEWKLNRSEGDSFYFLDPDGHQLEAHVGTLSSRIAQCRDQPYAGMRIFD